MADSNQTQLVEGAAESSIPEGSNDAQEPTTESKEAEPAQGPVSGSGEPLAPHDDTAGGSSQSAKTADIEMCNEECAVRIPSGKCCGIYIAPEEETGKRPKEDVRVNIKSADAQTDARPGKSGYNPEPSDTCQQREDALIKKIEELGAVETARSEEGLRLELIAFDKVRDEEIDLLKARVKNLETELQAALTKPSGKNQEIIEKIKQQHEELLSKARGMIFDKTKMVKNQELQIEALTTQVQSLKDINVITKDLLEIRNSEIKAMEERFAAMEARFKAERERCALVLKRAQTGTAVNDDLRREYETQLAIFKELREKYEQRVKALVAENQRLKGSSSTSG